MLGWGVIYFFQKEINHMKCEITKDKLVADVKEVIADAECLLKETAHDASAKAQELRGRMSRKLEMAKQKFWEIEEAVKEKAAYGIRQTDQLVREHPYESIGMAFGIGLLAGVLINRK